MPRTKLTPQEQYVLLVPKSATSNLQGTPPIFGYWQGRGRHVTRRSHVYVPTTGRNVGAGSRRRPPPDWTLPDVGK